MSPDPLELLWRSAANQPTVTEMENHRAVFASTLSRRLHRFTVAISIAGVVLAAMTGAMLLGMLRSGAPALAGEWALVALLVPPWIGFVLFVRRHRRLRDQHPDYSRSIAEALGGTLAETRFAQARLRTIALLHGLSLPLLGLAVHQLWAAGRATSGEAISLAAVLAGLLGGTGVALAYRYFGQLRRRERALQELLASYG
jgi:hypothetical protein